MYTFIHIARKKANKIVQKFPETFQENSDILYYVGRNFWETNCGVICTLVYVLSVYILHVCVFNLVIWNGVNIFVVVFIATLRNYFVFVLGLCVGS